jgi:hypothetical protein
MSLTTNYDRKDWIDFSLKLLVEIILPACGVLFILFTLVLPMIEVMSSVIPILTEDWVVEHIRDVAIDDGNNISTVLLYYVFTLSGGVLIPIFILLWSMSRLFDLGSWVMKNVTSNKLIIFRNGVKLIGLKL